MLRVDSHEMSSIIFSKKKKVITKLAVCCSNVWYFNLSLLGVTFVNFSKQFGPRSGLKECQS